MNGMFQPKKSTERHEVEKVDRGLVNSNVDIVKCTGTTVSYGEQ